MIYTVHSVSKPKPRCKMSIFIVFFCTFNVLLETWVAFLADYCVNLLHYVFVGRHILELGGNNAIIGES